MTGTAWGAKVAAADHARTALLAGVLHSGTEVPRTVRRCHRPSPGSIDDHPAIGRSGCGAYGPVTPDAANRGSSGRRSRAVERTSRLRKVGLEDPGRRSRTEQP